MGNLDIIIKGFIIFEIPIVEMFLIVYCTIQSKHKGKTFEKLSEDLKNRNQFCRKANLYERRDYVTEILIYASVLCILILVVLEFDTQNICYVKKLANKIESIENIGIGLTTLVVTLSIFIVTFEKRYYLVFSIRDILQKRKFPEYLNIVIVSFFLILLEKIILPDGSLDNEFEAYTFIIFEIAVILNMLCSARLLYIMLRVIFKESEKELNIFLDQLYHWFEPSGKDTTHFSSEEKWSKDAVGKNVECLTENYIKVFQNKKISRIKNINFILTIDTERGKWLKKAKIIFYSVFFASWTIACVLNIIYQDENMWKIVGSIITGISFLIIAVFHKIDANSFDVVIMELFCDIAGYDIYYKKNEKKEDMKEVFVPRVPCRKTSIFHKYIRSMNSLIAFFDIWSKYADGKKQDIRDAIEQLIDRIQEQEKGNLIIYNPVFIIGYFLFEKGIKIGRLREVYKNFSKRNVDKNEDSLFEMVYSQICVLLRKYESEEVYDKVGKYFDWLEKK